jgi:hypothetical protein
MEAKMNSLAAGFRHEDFDKKRPAYKVKSPSVWPTCYFKEFLQNNGPRTFLEIENLESELKNLKAESKKFKRMATLKEERIEEWRRGYSEARDSFDKSLMSRLAENSNPMGFFERYSRRGPMVPPLPVLPPWEDFERALQLLPEGEGISKKDREKKLQEIRKKMQAIEASIQELSPPHFFKHMHGYSSGVSDYRRDLVQHWYDIQGIVVGGCDPHGIDIRDCPESVQEAYRILEIAQFIPSAGSSWKYRPARLEESSYGVYFGKW